MVNPQGGPPRSDDSGCDTRATHDGRRTPWQQTSSKHKPESQQPQNKTSTATCSVFRLFCSARRFHGSAHA
eukprot:14729208-Alexandrium_andersonii.AAC.1